MLHKSIKEKLETAFPESTVEVVDTSAGHESHNSLTNLAVSVFWTGFEGMSLIDQHKKVHEVLAEELKTVIHALRVKTGVKE